MDTSPTIANGSDPPSQSTPLPPFLSLTRQQIQQKFIDLEWEQRNRLLLGRQGSPSERFALLSGDDYASRNRYANVEVFTNNRIRLKLPEGCEANDYINASPIRLQDSVSGAERYFIATQGPKEGIFGHVWRMVWEECGDVVVIVMLTQTHESGREKCFQYFPRDMEDPVLAVNEDEELEDDFKAVLTLKSVTEDKSTQSTVREMELRKEDGGTKTVWHLLFEGWPDFSIPEDEARDALVRLIHLSEEKNSVKTSPRIVHCSAGVGRSGTFIALDHLIKELAAGNMDVVPEEKDPIAEVVDELRQQRMMMVQSDSQYYFLYDLVRQLWKERQEGASNLKAEAETNGSTAVGPDEVIDEGIELA